MKFCKPFTRVTMVTFATVAGALLAACGGGGGDEAVAAPASSVIDKYVGVWVYTCELESAVPGGERSNRGTITATKVSSNSMDLAPVEQVFQSVDCSGAFTTTVYTTVRLTDTGIRQVAGEAVDSFLATGVGGSGRTISLIKDGKLYGDDEASPQDADGYHTAIDFTSWAVKQ